MPQGSERSRDLSSRFWKGGRERGKKAERRSEACDAFALNAEQERLGGSEPVVVVCPAVCSGDAIFSGL